MTLDFNFSKEKTEQIKINPSDMTYIDDKKAAMTGSILVPQAELENMTCSLNNGES